MIDAALLPRRNDRVTLRPLRVRDAAAFAEGAGDEAVREHAHLPAPSYTLESTAAMIEGEAREGLARGDLAVLAIATPDDAFAGSLVLFDATADDAEVGFWLHPRSRGRGLAGAALDLAAQVAADSGLAWLTARASVDNPASHRVLEEAGFVEASRGPDHAPSGREVELVRYSRFLGERIGFPLATPRLHLRPHTADDAGWIHHVYADPDVARYLLEPPWTREDAGRHVATRQERTGLETAAGALALVVEHGGEPVGDVALWLTDRRRRVAEIGWVLDPRCGGQGFAAEAARATLDLAFDRYRLHRVSAQMDARNEPSARLAATIGMHREAHLRQDWWCKGEWTDTLVFGALASDR